MKISKKIVSIGSIAAIIAPIAVSASCGGQSTSTSINVQIKKPEIKFYGKSDGGTPNKGGKTNYGTFRIHIPELGISYQGYNSVPFKADNINTSPVDSPLYGRYKDSDTGRVGDRVDGNMVYWKYPTITWNKNKNLNSKKGIGHDVEITITLKPGPGISSINGKKEVQYTYTVNKDKILYDMRAIEDFGTLRNREKKKAWISKARKSIEDRLKFKDPKSLKKGEHIYTFGSVTKIPDNFWKESDPINSTFLFLPGDIDFSSVTEIGDYAFQKLTSLPENINFSSVTKIGEYSFGDLQSLPENIDFSNLTEIGDNALDSLKSLPENINFSSVTEIGDDALDSLKSLPENINFSSVTEIGEKALFSLESLPENIDFSNVTKIGTAGFRLLKSLPKNIDFSNLTEIGELSFGNLRSLPENIDFSSVTKIGKNAFFVDDMNIGYAKILPEKIRFNHKITYDEFYSAFSLDDKEKYDESWFNAHRNPAKTTTP